MTIVKPGKVYLIGAGPGDPKLITVRGLEALRAADAVVYDRLASPLLLKHAKPGAEKIFAGKLPDKHQMKQEDINRLLIDLAHAGKIVARLKGGDPTVFGRVGEEAEALAELGIPFEIIPGVTSATAVPAYAGIPVTHRDFASSFSIVTGHEKTNKTSPGVDWEPLARTSGTLVFLMGVANLGRLADELISRGRDPETPAAVIRWGTWMEQRTLVGSLATIARQAEEAGFSSPAVIVIGEVVRMRGKIAWFEKKPLFGLRVLVTRASEQAGGIAARIDELGGEAVEWPVIRLDPLPTDPEHDAFSHPESYDWLLFTSVNGVRFFFEACARHRVDVRRYARARIGAVGPKTAEALESKGWYADRVPSVFQGDELAKALLPLIRPGERALLPRARAGRADLPELLRQAGMVVDDLPIYETRIPDEGGDEAYGLLQQGKIGAVAFTSSSTVTNLLELLARRGRERPAEALAGVPAFCIGELTAQTAREAGLDVAAVAAEATIPALVDAMIAYNIRRNGGDAS